MSVPVPVPQIGQVRPQPSQPINDTLPPSLEFLDLIATPIQGPRPAGPFLYITSVSLGEDDSIWITTEGDRIFRKRDSISSWEELVTKGKSVDASNYNTAVMIDTQGRPYIYVGGASEWMKIPGPNIKLSKVSIGADGYILASEGNNSPDIYCLSAKGNSFYKIDTSHQKDFSVGDANNVWAVSMKGFSGYVDTYAQRIIITGDKGNRSQPLQIGEGKVAGEVGADVAANLVGVSRGGARVVALGNDRRLYTLTSKFSWKHISEIPPSYISALSVNRNAFVVLDPVKGTITKYTPRAAAAAALPAGVAAAPPQSIQNSAALQQRIASTAAVFAARAAAAPAAPPTAPPSQATPTASGCADLVFRMNNLMKDYTALKDRFKDVDKTISGARVQTLLAGGGKRKKKYSVSRKLKARSSRKKRNSGKKSIKRR